MLASDHEYGALDLMWESLCDRAGATYVRRRVPAPAAAEEAVEAIWSGVTERTRVLFVSHVTSQTSTRFDVEELCRRARDAGIVTIVDGAHAPGHLPLDLNALGADFYAGNCHKWLCAPKGAGFLSVGEEQRERLEPLVVSWGWTPDAPFVRRHEQQGTRDPAAYLAVPAAIEFHREHWDEVRRRCHALLEDASSRLEALGLKPLTPRAAWPSQMASFALPPGRDVEDVRGELLARRIEVYLHEWRDTAVLRVSIQAYNDQEDIDRLEDALRQIL